jgi:hypothetical protein
VNIDIASIPTGVEAPQNTGIPVITEVSVIVASGVGISAVTAKEVMVGIDGFEVGKSVAGTCVDGIGAVMEGRQATKIVSMTYITRIERDFVFMDWVLKRRIMLFTFHIQYKPDGKIHDFHNLMNFHPSSHPYQPPKSWRTGEKQA